MVHLLGRIQFSPAQIRVLPLVLVAVLTVLQGRWGIMSAYWLYGLKMVAAAGLLWVWRRHLGEMRWQWSWAGLGTGVGVFVLWVGLDSYYPKPGTPETGWRPTEHFADAPGLAWFWMGFRLLASSLVVPALEEVFYRSFLYRWIQSQDFLKVSLGRFDLKAFVITAAIFGVAHREWLAGVLCGAAYQGLVCWKNRLGDAMIAHGVTNALLGLWVIWKGAWQFW